MVLAASIRISWRLCRFESSLGTKPLCVVAIIGGGVRAGYTDEPLSGFFGKLFTNSDEP